MSLRKYLTSLCLLPQQFLLTTVKVKLKSRIVKFLLDNGITVMTLASCPEGQSYLAFVNAGRGGTYLQQPGPLGGITQLGVAEHLYLIGLAWER